MTDKTGDVELLPLKPVMHFRGTVTGYRTIEVEAFRDAAFAIIAKLEAELASARKRIEELEQSK